MRAGIVAIGSELIRYRRIDTNSSFLSAELERLGHGVDSIVSVGDHEAEIRWVLGRMLSRYRLVIATGGLGPTEDDRTRAAVARLLRRRLVRDPELLELIRRRLRHLPDAARRYNLERQAEVIRGAELLANPAGTAPGQWIRRGGRHLILLPGVPGELRAIWDSALKSRLPVEPAQPVARLRTVGLAESDVDLRLRELERRFRDLEITTLAQRGQVDVFVRRRRGALGPVLRRARALLAPALFAEGDAELGETVGRLLRERRLQLAVAESCSGGCLARMITAVAGASDYFAGGVVAYANRVKQEVLGVSDRRLEASGAVSGPVAAEMAKGVRARLGTDLALAITGVAGPGGGSSAKPVGLVYIALDHSGGTQVEELRLRGARREIQQQSALYALRLLWHHLQERT
ncbi:MAG TPA: CinA family nicotinamide mononucleotide deamidase-related protein [Acidobacteriota bacterium]